ncbi:TonB-dependent siderophore receptor [Pseudoduganella sp. RAF53_2]|uniref:TonB-dependent siderophore receptor n=1 Tax=unclassified Pseudoduganella TaxID=2637179 RepID=UPI003F9D6FCA
MVLRTAKLGCMAAAIAAAFANPASAQQTAPDSVPATSTAAAPAQDVATTVAAAESPAAPVDGLKLERVVVTGTASRSSKMRSSVSVSTMDAENIALAAPTSAAEVLRSIPGVRSESSGGEGNANITVRGVPISAGGSRYVQIQEDGLPVLQSGDFNFITPDSYVKIDGTLDHLEVVRGGSASTLATNSPGGIINFISKTGEQEGGNLGIQRGLGYDETRYDFDYGGRFDAKTRFFIGGHYRTGEGQRNTGMSTEDGGQIRGNVTRELDNGWIRFSFKHLDDKAPTALPVPVRVTNGQISEIPGIDPRTATFYSPYWTRDVSLTKDNGRASSNVNDGLRVKSDSFGIAAQFDLGNGFTISDNFRKSSNSGRFLGVFPGNNGVAGNYVFATGPNKGKAYNDLAFSAVVFNTSIDDAGNTLNDLKLSKTFNVEGGKLTATGGLYSSIQKLGLTWNFNEYLMQLSEDKPALLQTASPTPGYVGPAFGGCCMRAVDMEYKLLSPYLNLGWEKGPLNVDASVRQDRQRADGTANIAANGLQYNASTEQQVDYKINHTSYSVGGNYQFDRNLAVFARVSEGVAFNADRILFSTPLDGSAPININTVKQYEGGVKWRSGGASAFLTLFHAKTDESNFEATTQISTANRYKASGAELEAAWSLGDFRINGGVTYTDAEIVGAAAGQESTIGHTPRRQARFTYQIAPSYVWGQVTVGGSVVGTGRSWADDANTINMPAFHVVNLFARYQFNQKLSMSLSANNVLNKIGYTEVEGDGHAARSIGGRAVKAGLNYSF